jgi:hypothetical protein
MLVQYYLRYDTSTYSFAIICTLNYIVNRNSEHVMQHLYCRENIIRMQCYSTMIHCFLCVNVCFLFSLVTVAGGAMEALEFLDVVHQYCFVYLCTSLSCCGYLLHLTSLVSTVHICISWTKTIFIHPGPKSTRHRIFSQQPRLIFSVCKR